MAAKTIHTSHQAGDAGGQVNEELLLIIERLRYELAAAAEERTFTSERVLELSQRLDKYIVLAQHQMVPGRLGRRADPLEHRLTD